MDEKKWFTTHEVAKFLSINEKVVYSLIAEKGLPATKVTGKWLFPRHLVEHWLESQTVNCPEESDRLVKSEELLIVSGSDDLLLDRAISLFNRNYPDRSIVYGNFGSLGGIRALKRDLCHIAASHLLQDDTEEYNFRIAREELGRIPAVVNFCRREQGLVVRPGNPQGIKSVADLLGKEQKIRIVNRPPGTGTRLLFDRKLHETGINTDQLVGYDEELTHHLDIGLTVLGGRADAGPCIRAVAGLLGLDFLPWGWERFDLLILKERFFDEIIQLFLGSLGEPAFRETVRHLEGYDLTSCGKMIFPGEEESR
jgi:putative molybdopterin biosynthesis protein